ncbi:MAG: cation diffusion facilitator family transporter, partial [Alphaproteobacteria bacterium]
VGSHYLGLAWLDTSIAVFEALDLLYLGGGVFWEAYKGLMDRSVGSNFRNQVVTLAREVPGVIDVTHIRSRHIGQEIWIEMVVGVDRGASVQEAHDICEAVKAEISRKVEHIGALNISAQGNRRDTAKPAPAPAVETDELVAGLESP